MNFSDFITHHGKRVNKEFFFNLIQVSKSDGKIAEAELKSLYKTGKKFGLTDPEIDQMIIAEGNVHYVAPYSLEEKFEHLYNVATMILADNIIDDSEKRLIRKFAIEAGFNDKVIDKLLNLLFEGIRNNENEESLFDRFKKQIFQ
jgi:hypothetical protein